MSTTEFNSLREKVDAGIQLAVKKLREKTKLEGGELVVSKHGKIIRLQAKDISAS